MERKTVIAILLVVLSLVGCRDQSSIEGLWVVSNVKVGDKEMTPNAQWMRFNADFTRQSGNGWLKHSYGT